MKITELKSADFNGFIAEGVSLVDYWATWCGPCRMMAPVLEQATEQLPTVKFGKVNVDDEPQLAKDADVSSIPNLCIYKDGKLVDRLIGCKPLSVLVDTIKKYL